MTAPWDSDALWEKARLFVGYALDEADVRLWDERALWASLALELLGKSALARESPLLIAVPNEEGKNLLIASGLAQGEAAFKSIAARSLFKRCGRAFRPFNDREAIRIADDRNAYLHDSTPSLTPLPEEAWWPKYWAQARVLVHACDKTLADLVGQAHVAMVESALEKNAENIQARVQMLIGRASQKLALYQSGKIRAAEAREWERPADLTGGYSFSSAAVCPACHSADGTLEGSGIVDQYLRTEEMSEDDYDVWVDLTVEADYFSCEVCHLVLDSFDLVEAAGLPEEIEATGDPSDFWEPDYGND